MKIITQQLAEDIPKNHALLANQVVNPQNFEELFQTLRTVQNLTVYDITKTKAHPPKSIIKVKDHINRTGENPLISHQKKLNIDFIDITKIYKIEKNAVNTDCCGKKLNKKYTYPSHYLCNISILAKAMGIKKISAFLVNIP